MSDSIVKDMASIFEICNSISAPGVASQTVAQRVSNG